MAWEVATASPAPCTVGFRRCRKGLVLHALLNQGKKGHRVCKKKKESMVACNCFRPKALQARIRGCHIKCQLWASTCAAQLHWAPETSHMGGQAAPVSVESLAICVMGTSGHDLCVARRLLVAPPVPIFPEAARNSLKPWIELIASDLQLRAFGTRGVLVAAIYGWTCGLQLFGGNSSDFPYWTPQNGITCRGVPAKAILSHETRC